MTHMIVEGWLECKRMSGYPNHRLTFGQRIATAFALLLTRRGRRAALQKTLSRQAEDAGGGRRAVAAVMAFSEKAVAGVTGMS